MKSDQNPLNQFNQTGGSNFFDDFFNITNNFRSSNGDLPNTPPTQEGVTEETVAVHRGQGRPGGPRQQAHPTAHKVFLKSSNINMQSIARHWRY